MSEPVRDPEVIELDRGDKGLGFNIKGGIDQQHVPGDDGIFVTKIRDDGAAAVDGRLQKGDRILEINTHDVQKVPHKQAVDHFLSAGNKVILKVVHGAEEDATKKVSDVEKNNPNAPTPTDGNGKGGSAVTYLLLTVGAVVVVTLGVLGYRKLK